MNRASDLEFVWIEQAEAGQELELSVAAEVDQEQEPANEALHSNDLGIVWGEQIEIDHEQELSVAAQVREYHCPQDPEFVAVLCVVSTNIKQFGQYPNWYCPIVSTSAETIVCAFKIIQVAMAFDNFAPITKILTKDQTQFTSSEFSEFCREIQAEHRVTEFVDLATPSFHVLQE